MSAATFRKFLPKMKPLFIFILLISLFLSGAAPAVASVFDPSPSIDDPIDPAFVEFNVTGNSGPADGYDLPANLMETIYTSGFDQISILTNYPMSRVNLIIESPGTTSASSAGEILTLNNNTTTFYANQFEYMPDTVDESGLVTLGSIVNITIYYYGKPITVHSEDVSTLAVDNTNDLPVDPVEMSKTFRFKAVMTEDGNEMTFIPYETISAGEIFMHHDFNYFDANYSTILSEDGPINAIYLYGTVSGLHQLQSYYWYKQPETFSYNSIPADETLKSYNPTFTVDTGHLEDVGEFNLNTVFLCAINHDKEMEGNIPEFNYTHCGIFGTVNINDQMIATTVTNETQIVYESDALTAVLHEHRRMLTLHLNLSEAGPYLDSALSEQIYKLTFNPGTGYDTYTVPFIFKFTEPGVFNIPISKTIDPDSGKYIVKLPKMDVPDGKTQSISNLSFPSQLEEVLDNNSMTINFNVDSDDFFGNTIVGTTNGNSDGDSDPVLISCFDIKFKNDINEVLKENRLTVDLVFKIPKKVNGEDINANEIVIYHKNQSGQLEKLPIQIDSSDPNYFIVTAQTSGFSPFAAVLVSQPVPPASNSSGTAVGQATIIDSEPTTVPSQIIQPEPSKPSTVDTIVYKIQGYFSTFSVLVVLISGIAMWNYLRKSI
ncbi:hypothetical protein MsAg5_10900 [Methanosarcinaceae archaeon Ag5]|uniref:Uncharacterized protein n=1 Tax=Methanolapillus africanus TaxID=3028297 RepID=A0AAE4MJQ2_9EURY|nr:hypothetical protein [Methanosarcinaceae archaeon Ag5]